MKWFADVKTNRVPFFFTKHGEGQNFDQTDVLQELTPLTLMPWEPSGGKMTSSKMFVSASSLAKIATSLPWKYFRFEIQGFSFTWGLLSSLNKPYLYEVVSGIS